LVASLPFRLNRLRHLTDFWGENFEKKFHDHISFLLKQDLEIFYYDLTRGIALDANGKDILFNLGHGCLTNEFLVLFAKHDFAVPLQLGILLQVFADVHHLRWVLVRLELQASCVRALHSTHLKVCRLAHLRSFSIEMIGLF